MSITYRAPRIATVWPEGRFIVNDYPIGIRIDDTHTVRGRYCRQQEVSASDVEFANTLQIAHSIYRTKITII